MFCIEVLDKECACWAPASVKNIRNDELQVCYENDWKPAEWVKEDCVRPAGPKFDPATFVPKLFDEVEIHAQNSPKDPYTWWGAQVITVPSSSQQNVYTIKFLNWGNEQYVDKTSMRPKNPHANVKISELHSIDIALPKDLQKKAVLTDFKALTRHGILSVQMKQGGKAVSLLGSSAAIRKSQVMCTMMFAHLSEVIALRVRKEKNNQSIEEIKSRRNTDSKLTFTVEEPLIGLVIGAAGVTIKKAQAVKGVHDIQLRDGIVTITGANKPALEKAKALLDFQCWRYYVPVAQVRAFIGAGHKYMNDIKTSAGLTKIITPASSWSFEMYEDLKKSRPAVEEYADTRQFAEIMFIGVSSSMDLAKAAVQMHMSNLEERMQLMVEERESQQELSQMQGNKNNGRGKYGRGGNNNNNYNNNNNNNNNFSKMKCHKCGQGGHFARDCPTKKGNQQQQQQPAKQQQQQKKKQKQKQPQQQQQQQQQQQKQQPKQKQQQQPKQKQQQQQPDGKKKVKITCLHCKKVGHKRAECRTRLKEQKEAAAAAGAGNKEAASVAVDTPTNNNTGAAAKKKKKQNNNRKKKRAAAAAAKAKAAAEVAGNASAGDAKKPANAAPVPATEAKKQQQSAETTTTTTTTTTKKKRKRGKKKPAQKPVEEGKEEQPKKQVEQPKKQVEQPKKQVEQPKKNAKEPKTQVEQPKKQVEESKQKVEEPKQKVVVVEAKKAEPQGLPQRVKKAPKTTTPEATDAA